MTHRSTIRWWLLMISQTAEYALRAIVCLATANGVPRTRQEISEAAHIPLDYLTRVMQKLSDHDIVSVKRGPGGGYRMVSPPETVSVLDVVAAVEPLPRIEKCPLGIADHRGLCPLHARLDEAAAMVETAFRKTSIIDLIPTAARGSNQLRRCAFPPSGPSRNRSSS